MPEAASKRPPRLPLRRQVNRLVVGGLLTTLTIPVGSTIAQYEGEQWPHAITVAAAVAAFLLIAIGLRIGPTKDARKVVRRGIPARAVVQRVSRVPMTQRRGDQGPTVAEVMLLDLRVEAEGEPVTRVRLRRWVDADMIDQLRPGTVLEAKVLPGRPQDPALGLDR